MKPELLRVGVPVAVLAVLFIGIAGWTWSWPDHPLIPDEAIAKTMVESVVANGTPFGGEPIRDYASGTFATDSYGGAYRDHEIARPPTSIATSFEQGLFGVKFGRLLTLAVGTAAVAYLAARIGGAWTGMLGGALYMAHPATLYFHQSYFSNSGGAAYFLASLALLEASRRWWFLAPFSVLAAGISMVFRIEYAFGFVATVTLAFTLFRGWRPLVGYYGAVAVLVGFLLNLESMFPFLTYEKVFTETIPLQDFLLHPWDTFQRVIVRYRAGGDLSAHAEWGVYAQHANDYFAYFFPLTTMLAIVGVIVRATRLTSTWVYAPLGVQTLVQAYAILPALDGFDFSNVSWLESSVVRYFLSTYALMAILAAVALGAIVRVAADLRPSAPRVAPIVAVALALIVMSASIATAVRSEHGVAWANERRAWFNEIEHAAEDFGRNAVFVGKTPGKVIFSRPVMNPENQGWNAAYATNVVTDLIAKDHRVFAFEPWYWNDHGRSIESMLQTGGHTYWTDTGVVVDCPCGEFARFYELHRTNSTLTNVARIDSKTFVEGHQSLVTASERATFYPERALHIRLGLATTRGVEVEITFRDEGNATYVAGYWNLPFENAKNEHPAASWATNGTGALRTIAFRIAPDEVVNGAFYIAGPPGLPIERLVVRPL